MSRQYAAPSGESAQWPFLFVVAPSVRGLPLLARVRLGWAAECQLHRQARTTYDMYMNPPGVTLARLECYTFLA